MAKTGRPPEATKKIDKEELEKLLRLHPSKKDVCDWFDVSESTVDRFCRTEFNNSFDELRDKRAVQTRMAIKRMQIEMALKGDRVMLIWMGKQMLGQVEKTQFELHKVPDDQLIEVVRERVKLLEAKND